MSLLQDARHHLHNTFYQTPVPFTAARVLRLLLTPEFRLVARFRLYNWLDRAGWRWLAYFIYLRTKALYGCDIACSASIGPGMRIVHASDIVIGPEVVAGRDLVLFNGVTLGNRLDRRDTKGMPTLGDRVLLGTGAKVLGPVALGDGARIGANAVVLIPVPMGKAAVGIPARIID